MKIHYQYGYIMGICTLCIAFNCDILFIFQNRIFCSNLIAYFNDEKIQLSRRNMCCVLKISYRLCNKNLHHTYFVFGFLSCVLNITFTYKNSLIHKFWIKRKMFIVKYLFIYSFFEMWSIYLFIISTTTKTKTMVERVP